MDKILVAMFDEEKKVYEGSKALAGLDDEGSIALFSTAVITKDQDGKVIVKQEADRGPLGTAVGALTGSLAGLFGGTLGVVVGAAAGTLAGISYDWAKLGVGSDFIAEIGDQLQPGKYALIAEIEEDWVTPIDTSLEKAGATKVLRRAREDVVDQQIERDVAAARAELAGLKAEYKRAGAEQKARLEARIDAARERVRDLQQRAKTNLVRTAEESRARTKKLQLKLKKVRGEARAKLGAGIAQARKQQERRSEKLRKAWERAKEAMRD
ncbi:MAG TPA: DUF1269 domain-containing protein [Myxococcales bacterium]|nr:DUF1269 domain-containing protein [Myxococcales bacterium]